MQKEGKEIAFVIRYLESDTDIFTLHLGLNKVKGRFLTIDRGFPLRQDTSYIFNFVE